MKTLLEKNDSLETSELAQESAKNGKLFSIPITGIFWVITILLGIFLTLMLLFVSLAFWVVTKNPLFVISALFGGTLFVIWGYLNLKDKDHLKKPKKVDSEI
ncbi:MAG: hypothetical protein ACFFFH_12740 [Candidatus Thorarchaeota archaeon]